MVSTITQIEPLASFDSSFTDQNILQFFIIFDRMKIQEYLNFVRKTDRLPIDDLSPVLHGLFGEVGGVMTVAKKIKREPGVFTGFNSVLVEEFGDAFWYLCCLAIRLDLDLHEILIGLMQRENNKPDVVVGHEGANFSLSYEQVSSNSFDEALVQLGQITGNFLSIEYVLDETEKKVHSFLQSFFDVLMLMGVEFGLVLNANISKVSSRFIRPNNSELPTFDFGFPDFERLPDEFEIEFIQRTETRQAIRWRGIFLGDPLTDSISGDDGYRFHDVFHFSNAAILHWSPTFRALLKRKRKSNSLIDETQDGGRAIVVEEGLTAWIFTIAKENELFANNESLTFDMLKNIAQFVKGFEVESVPLVLWEECILQGYEVFRYVVENSGGIVVGNRSNRTVRYLKS